MAHSDIKIRTFSGSAIKNYLSSLARLRIEVFRDYPYLYEGDMQYETHYLKKYVNCKEAVVVLVFDNSEIVGASTGIPLSIEVQEIQKPFKEKKLDIPSYYYFSESLLLKKYRGRGIGHHFFDEREAHVHKLKKYKHICFACVERGEDTHKPSDYMPLDDFWKKRGYVKHPELIAHFPWKDIGEHEETDKPLVFWIKDIS
jgi:GNAT superfamily N-acetyltransferase